MARILLVGFVLTCLTPESSQAAKKRKDRPAPSLDQVFQPDQLKEDVKVLRKALEEGHPGLYLYTPKEEFDQKFEQVDKTFDRPMTLREFYLEVAPLVEKVYCGHTYFDLPPKLLKSLQKEAALFPLPLAFLNKRAYVDHAKTSLPLGAEITANAKVPVIGIGAGPDTDGQILVIYDILGLSPGRKPRFVKNFMDDAGTLDAAAADYVAAVKDGRYPAPEHAFS